MRLTSVFGFVQTAAALASGQSRTKGEYILVQCHSVATGYQVTSDGFFSCNFFRPLITPTLIRMRNGLQVA